MEQKKFIKIIGIILIMFFLFLIFKLKIIDSNSKDFENCETMPAKEMNIRGHQNLALHIHPNLRIVINRIQQEIPENIGLSPTIMRPIHTHDTSEDLHIESPCPRDFYLWEFFEIWEKNFNSTCIFEHCTNGKSLKMYVNGQENFEFENLILKDDDLIEIIYGEI